VARTKKDRSTPQAGESAPANRSGTGAKPRGRPFVPGQSGNPNGRPKDVLGIQRFAREYGIAAIEKLVKLMEGAESERAHATAAVAILDRGCGKPTQPIE
jgi:Family of unknown function (DUF5681)